MHYHQTIRGPLKVQIMYLFDLEKNLYAELECGHAVLLEFWDLYNNCHQYGWRVRWRMNLRKAKGGDKKRFCIMCTKNRVSPNYFKRGVPNVKEAKLEGKRLRALAIYQARGEEPPEIVKRQRHRLALFESIEQIPTGVVLEPTEEIPKELFEELTEVEYG
jgi:hypothetical protein